MFKKCDFLNKALKIGDSTKRQISDKEFLAQVVQELRKAVPREHWHVNGILIKTIVVDDEYASLAEAAIRRAGEAVSERSTSRMGVRPGEIVRNSVDDTG